MFNIIVQTAATLLLAIFYLNQLDDSINDYDNQNSLAQDQYIQGQISYDEYNATVEVNDEIIGYLEEDKNTATASIASAIAVPLSLM